MPDDYVFQQEKAKKKGLCKNFREGIKCGHGVNCIFYHGKIEDTYGIQPCRHRDKCVHLQKGECKFVHDPSESQIYSTKAFYSLFSLENDLFYISRSKSNLVDFQCKNDPFIILKKEETTENNVYYSIPICLCIVTNNYGVKFVCNKPVRFMSKEDGTVSSFYCSHEHMITSEPNCQSYVVKQNILDIIFPNT
jgi:hypothetical protein